MSLLKTIHMCQHVGMSGAKRILPEKIRATKFVIGTVGLTKHKALFGDLQIRSHSLTNLNTPAAFHSVNNREIYSRKTENTLRNTLNAHIYFLSIKKAHSSKRQES